jgi:alpha-tubulin suppressor-like RCC1 family protein
MFLRRSRASAQTVWRWGNSGGSSLGSLSDLTKKPTPIPALKGIDCRVQSISNGSDHSVTVINGNLLTFGSNKYQQLGRIISGDTDYNPVAAVIDNPAVSVSCGGWHSISLHENGSLKSFGWGGSLLSGAGALGQGSKAPVGAPTTIEFFEELSDRVIQVACGQQHSLFLTESGAVFATGHGAYGILGTGETSDELLPVQLTALDATLINGEKIVKIACGGSFSAFVTDQGNLYVWGRNDSGQLGLGEESQGDMHSAERYPRRIPFFETERTFIKDIACGENHIVALAQNGALYSWGDRTWLEPHVLSLPEANGGLKGITRIVAGSKCSFALSSSGIVYAWGMKSSGCLVLENSDRNVPTPIAVPPAMFGNEKVVDIAIYRQRCMAVTTDEEYLATSEDEAKNLRASIGSKRA